MPTILESSTVSRATAASKALQRRPLLAVAVLAGALRLVFALVSFAVNDPWLIPDEGQYVGLATAVAAGRGAEAWFPGYGQSLYDGTRAFMVPLAALFEVVGPSRLVGQLWAAAFGVATAVGTALLARKAAGNRAALIAGCLVAALPSQVLWSSTVLRESLVWCGLVLVALGMARSYEPGRSPVAPLALVAAALLGLGYLRVQTMLAAAGAAVLVAWLLPRPQRPARGAFALMAALTIPMVVGVGPFGVDLLRESLPELGTTRTQLSAGAESAFASAVTVPPHRSTSSTTAPTTSSTSATSATSASAPRGSDKETSPPDTSVTRHPRTIRTNDGTEYAVDESLTADVEALPRGLVATTLRPFLWEPRTSITLRLASLENLVWYVLYAVAVAGAWAGRRRLDVLAVPLVTAGALVVGGALTQGNLGTAFRHRGQIFWIVALLASFGIEQRLAARSATSHA